MKFRLVKNAGIHKQAGRVYRAGEVVENDADLSKLFPGKFEVLEGPAEDDINQSEDQEASETHTPFDNAQTRKRSPQPAFKPRAGTAEDAVAEVDAETERAIAEGEAEATPEGGPADSERDPEGDEEDESDEEEGVTRGNKPAQATRRQTRTSQSKAASKAAKNRGR